MRSNTTPPPGSGGQSPGGDFAGSVPPPPSIPTEDEIREQVKKQSKLLPLRDNVIQRALSLFLSKAFPRYEAAVQIREGILCNLQQERERRQRQAACDSQTLDEIQQRYDEIEERRDVLRGEFDQAMFEADLDTQGQYDRPAIERAIRVFAGFEVRETKSILPRNVLPPLSEPPSSEQVEIAPPPIGQSFEGLITFGFAAVLGPWLGAALAVLAKFASIAELKNLTPGVGLLFGLVVGPVLLAAMGAGWKAIIHGLIVAEDPDAPPSRINGIVLWGGLGVMLLLTFGDIAVESLLFRKALVDSSFSFARTVSVETPTWLLWVLGTVVSGPMIVYKILVGRQSGLEELRMKAALRVEKEKEEADSPSVSSPGQVKVDDDESPATQIANYRRVHKETLREAIGILSKLQTVQNSMDALLEDKAKLQASIDKNNRMPKPTEDDIEQLNSAYRSIEEAMQEVWQALAGRSKSDP